MAKFLFVVDVKEDNCDEYTNITGCECKPTTIVEYLESLIKDGEHYNYNEILSVVFSPAIFKKYKNYIVKSLEEKGFFSKDTIDKASAIRLGSTFIIPPYGNKVDVKGLENLSQYEVNKVVNLGKNIRCEVEVEEDSLPKALRKKIEEARMALQKKEEGKKNKQEKITEKKIEEAKRILEKAGVKL